MAGWNHSGKFKTKKCVVCQTEFKPKSGAHKFCSSSCKGKWQYITGRSSTENQYKEISGNWKRYAQRLMYYGGRKRDQLSYQTILDKLEQQGYRCALSGIELTCKLEKGKKFPTNASIDRIIPGGPYTEDNIQIVCRALNHWRADTPLEDFFQFCKAVTEHQRQKEIGG